MPKQAYIDQILTIHQNVLNLNFDVFKNDPGGPYPEWNNLGIDDYIEAYEDMLRTQVSMFENNIIGILPWNIVHGMISQLNNVLQHCQQFHQQKTPQTFHQAFAQIENMRTNYLAWGIKYLIQIGKELEEKSNLIDIEIQKLLNANKEIGTIKDNVNKLIEPAIAGSLSKSFSNRKNDLHTNLTRWFWASATTALLSICATIWIVASIVGVFSDNEVIKILKENNSHLDGLFWSTVFLRIAILLPIYSVFAFAFSQYRKERNLEESYAHKAAVATSLPNYGDLAVEPGVKDQILSEASKVIFTSPISEKDHKTESKTYGVGEINELLDNLRKLMLKVKE